MSNHSTARRFTAKVRQHGRTSYLPVIAKTSISALVTVLNSLDITAAQFQLQRRTAVAQAVEYNRPQVILPDQLVEALVDHSLFIGIPIDLRHDQSIIFIFIA